jgi:Glycosyl hydrolase family 36 N-terminal domain
LLATGLLTAGFTSPILAAAPPPIVLKTRSLELRLQVEPDGRLYQLPLGPNPTGNRREDECYPQAGDGYIWEPALQVVHADGNTSTALVFDGMTQTNQAAGINLTRIGLHDPAYPFTVTLCFKTHQDEDLLEQWTEAPPPGKESAGREARRGLLPVAGGRRVPHPVLWRLGQGNAGSD